MRIGNLICVAALIAAAASAARADERFLITGAANVSSSGLQSPYYVLAKPEVQELAYAALNGPMPREQIERALARSEARIDDLLALDILRPTADGRFALGFNVETVADKRLVRRVAEPAGRSLAKAILAERPRIDAIAARYDLAGVDRREVLWALVACVMLDWDGLGVTAEEGYRQPPVRRPNGDKFQMSMLENAPDVSVRALYWGSRNEQAAGGEVVMTTFGDDETPDRLGFPDIKGRVGSRKLLAYAPQPGASALSGALYDRLDQLQDDAARIMVALRKGPASAQALAGAAGLDAAQTGKTLKLLVALRYVRSEGDLYRANVPVFTAARDEALLSEFRALGKDIMRRWLKANYAGVKRELAGLSAVKAGLAYDVAFTAVWHDLFGWTNYHLAQAGYLYDPYGPDAEFVSFAPFVWEAKLNLYEGTKIF
jgi:hypothetical protein